MEGVQTVDLLTLSSDHLSRTKSVSASEKPGTEAEPATSQAKSHRRHRSNSNPTLAPSTSEPKQASQNNAAPLQAKPPPVEKHEEQKPSTPSPASRKTDPKPIGRRNSWISSLSSKFSSGTTPPSQPSLKASPASPKTTSPLETHNPFGAAYFPRDKEEEKKDDSNPFTASSPKGPSFIHNALRKFSHNSGGLPKLNPNGAICPRRVMNIDQNRHRCKIADLNQAKLNRVAFCVDVEIAGISHRDDDEKAPPTNQLRQPLPESTSHKLKKADLKSKEQDEAGALKHPQATLAEKDSAPPVTASAPAPAPAPATGDAKVQSSSPPTNTTSKPSTDPSPSGEGTDPTRKQEKKKRSEAERKERKERKRRLAVANGSVPLQLDGDNDEEYSRGPALAPGVLISKPQSHPTTDPVRIYRRCCQLRETPILKRVVDEISKPSSTLAESPGTVAALDLSNFPMTSQDLTTFSDWLAVVPVRKLILENCALTDTSVRAILSALLATKTVEQMRYRRRRSRRPESPDSNDHERYGVVEKLSLKDNAKIGREGWRHISLFVHLSKSLKAIDLSGIPLPQGQVAIDGSETTSQPQSHMADVSIIFASALAERFAGDHLEELLMSECYPSVNAVKQICQATAKMGLRRLGFANNGLTREGLEHVVEYLKAGQCEGLDLGGNAIKDDLDLVTDAIEPETPLYALSLADCSLNPSVIFPLLQSLAQIHNLRFIDFSHNRELFSSQPNALGAFRRFLPKMTSLKRFHLADVDLSPDHVIGLAEVLPECPSLCHLNILENEQIVNLASTTDPVAQEEACAVYASMMAAVRVSRTIIAVDIDVPVAENNEVVKALGSQIVAYSLRNLEGGAIAEELSGSTSPLEDIPIPEILQHIVGHTVASEEPYDDEDEAAPDEDYVIGGTGVVKALSVCLGNLDQHSLDVLGEQSLPASGTTTPRRRKSRSVPTKRPRDMSKNLLESARNIRVRIHSALIREDRAGNDANYRRLQFLDVTLHKMIQRFEDEYPETRVIPPLPPGASVPDTISQHSGDDDGTGSIGASGNLNSSQLDETGGDEEDADQYAVGISRTSSMTSLHSRAMTSQEGHIHRIGQNLRRDFLKPSLVPGDGDEDFEYEDGDSHMAALRQKLDLLHHEQSLSQFDDFDADMAYNHLGSTVEELYYAQQKDTEGFERFKQSQIAAQINSGIRPRTDCDEPESKSSP
ncbi:Leucine-rich repeat, ribonuclease inhibitor subtype [Penicillium italicum]|uniref:Leucine-rich repeat, ribonuclease inhibitor subtype n=1 Tax=Penicillium italicum TaxID=40296 RepID=A0A0A2L497_PENIT|nr:Leucine-rich repeat, ribonuclease inhibitor subtype [Penicillium italicum]